MKPAFLGKFVASLPRPRLMPILVLAGTLAAGVKVGEIWTDARIVMGVQSAGAQAQSSPQPSRPRQLTPAAKPAESAAKPETMPAKPDAAPAKPEAASAVKPAPDQAVKPAPDSTEAALAAALPPPAPSNVNRDPTSFSKSEVELLQSLSQRREALEQRAKELDMRDTLLTAAAKQVDEKIAELKKIEAHITELLKQRDEIEEARLRSLVKVYENMKPAEAARIFEQLDMPILLDVVERMKEPKVAPILAQMNPGKAKNVTTDLAARRQLPSRMPEKTDKAG